MQLLESIENACQSQSLELLFKCFPVIRNRGPGLSVPSAFGGFELHCHGTPKFQSYVCPSFPSVWIKTAQYPPPMPNCNQQFFARINKWRLHRRPVDPCGFSHFFPRALAIFGCRKVWKDHIDPVPNKTHGSEKGKGNIPPQNMPVLVILNIEKEISPNIDRA